MKEKFSLATAFLFLSIFFGNALAQAFICPDLKFIDNPPNLEPVNNPNIAYKKRGSRCEGLYRASVSVGSLDLVSLLYGELTFSSSTMYVSSPKVRKQKVHVQAVGIPLKTYYRLDALVKPGRSLDWPLNLVKKIKLRPEQIGLFGELSDKKKTYVPLIVTETKAVPSVPLDLFFMLRASTDVSTVRWRKNTMKGELCDLSNTAWGDEKPIPIPSAGRFYAGHPIKLSLPSEANNFCIEFAAQAADTGKWLKRLLKIQITE